MCGFASTSTVNPCSGGGRRDRTNRRHLHALQSFPSRNAMKFVTVDELVNVIQSGLCASASRAAAPAAPPGIDGAIRLHHVHARAAARQSPPAPRREPPPPAAAESALRPPDPPPQTPPPGSRRRTPPASDRLSNAAPPPPRASPDRWRNLGAQRPQIIRDRSSRSMKYRTPFTLVKISQS